MKDKSESPPKPIRKLKRRASKGQPAQEASLGDRPHSEEQTGRCDPASRQAWKDLFGKLDWDSSFDYKKERSRH